MKILITGGNGFIGKSLNETLKEKYEVISYNSQELDLLDSAKVLKCLKENRFDVVIHTATYDAAPACSTKNPSMVLENNLRMFHSLARGQEYFGKMIYFGSGAEFSRENWIPEMTEDYFGQHIPSNPYGFSKYLMTKHAELNHNIYNLRLFGVFGKYDDWRYRFIPNTCAKAVLNLPVTINQNVCFDYLYIDDLIKIVEWFILNKPQKNVYNVCSGKKYDLKTLAQKVIQIANKDIEIKIKTEGLGQEYSGDNSRLLNELKYFEFNSIDNSIKSMLDWYTCNKHLINENDCCRFL